MRSRRWSARRIRASDRQNRAASDALIPPPAICPDEPGAHDRKKEKLKAGNPGGTARYPSRCLSSPLQTIRTGSTNLHTDDGEKEGKGEGGVSVLTHSAQFGPVHHGRVPVADGFPAPDLVDATLGLLRVGSKEATDDRLPYLRSACECVSTWLRTKKGRASTHLFCVARRVCEEERDAPGLPISLHAGARALPAVPIDADPQRRAGRRSVRARPQLALLRLDDLVDLPHDRLCPLPPVLRPDGRGRQRGVRRAPREGGRHEVRAHAEGSVERAERARARTGEGRGVCAGRWGFEREQGVSWARRCAKRCRWARVRSDEARAHRRQIEVSVRMYSMCVCKVR